MKKGFIYDGGMYPELKPEPDPANEKIQHYWDRLADWQRQKVKIENIENPIKASFDPSGKKFYRINIEGNLKISYSGQPCLHIDGEIVELIK